MKRVGVSSKEDYESGLLEWVRTSNHPAAKHAKLIALCYLNWPFDYEPLSLLAAAMKDAEKAYLATFEKSC